MNIYDKAHDLAKALNTSDEYQAVLKAKQPLASDALAKKMVNEFFPNKWKLSMRLCPVRRKIRKRKSNYRR